MAGKEEKAETVLKLVKKKKHCCENDDDNEIMGSTFCLFSVSIFP